MPDALAQRRFLLHVHVSEQGVEMPCETECGRGTREDARPATHTNRSDLCVLCCCCYWCFFFPPHHAVARALLPAHVVAQVIEGHNLLAADSNGLSDPYCKLRLGAVKYRTKTVPSSLFPVWDQVRAASTLRGA